MSNSKKRVLLVGLEPPESQAIIEQSDCLFVVYEYLPNAKLIDNELFVESNLHTGKYLNVDKVVYHGIFENDFDFLTMLALWAGDCLPSARGMMDCRLRHSGLVRALQISRFGKMKRGMSLTSEAFYSERMTVAKWGNWHCGENKAKFAGKFNPNEDATIYEEFIEGEAVRVFMVGEKFWQVRLTGDDWRKSIHHTESAEMPLAADLQQDTQNLANYFDLSVVGIDYMIAYSGEKYLLEVNHIPNITVFPFVRETFIDFVRNWINPLPRRGNN
jgi:hypothetical protein